MTQTSFASANSGSHTAQFTELLRCRLGDDRVASDTDTLRQYRASTTGVQSKVIAIIKPLSVSEVADVIQVANDTSVPIYPISTGMNWGYGSANPPVDGCAILDLSGMNGVMDLDSRSGLVTLEPGVTQQDLHDFLVEHNLPFMVPTHGGGPDCSLIGNLLERGYGITPIADHFYALRSLEAVLPNGRVYRSPLQELGGKGAHGRIKWQIGPYLDGMFTQSNFGIVTQATIKLARRPQCVEAFIFQLSSDKALMQVVNRVSDAISTIAEIGAVNLMNRLRVLAMNVPYPHHELGTSSTLPRATLERLGAEEGIAPWTGIGTLYGTTRAVAAAKADLKELLGPAVDKLSFVNRKRVGIIDKLTRWMPGQTAARLRRQLPSLNNFLDIASGIPSRIALPLAYWLSGTQVDTSQKLSPALDRCGLIWYSPLVPMDGQSVKSYIAMANDVCRTHGVEPLITLTSLSEDTFDSTLPILFDRRKVQRQDEANACYTELFRRGQENGWVPYRIPTNQMHLATDQQSAFWSLVQQIKDCVDPIGIISPGRYCPLSYSDK